jgi:ketosteroid isomerase-like protein
MTEQEIKDSIRGFFKAWTAGETKQAVSFFTEDAVCAFPRGIFKGTAEIEKYLAWVIKNTGDYKFAEAGIGIITRGDTAVDEHRLSGNSNGMKWELPGACVYEFKNGKIANMRGYYNVLFQAQQAAKGVIARWMVNAVVKASVKGLEKN